MELGVFKGGALLLDQAADAITVISLVGEDDRADGQRIEQFKRGRRVSRAARC